MRPSPRPEDAGAVLALSVGDPAGIGPEIALKAWSARKAGVPPFAVLADPAHLARVAARIGLRVNVATIEAEEAMAVFPHSLPVIPLPMAVEAQCGAPSPANAAATLAAIDGAVALVGEGRAAALVTNPINKRVLYEAGFAHPGHTEYLAALARARSGIAARAVMMLWSEQLAVVPVTIHVPLREVPDRLDADLIVETGEIVARDLSARFGMSRPRLAVAGLNPHAGEGGTLGREDEAVVRPAIERLRARGIDASGPYPADTLFHARARAGYDVALCMYHDQALIPLKALAFDEGVNVTLGLPFIRTSPDHGTAYDIAGTGVARPDSLIAALRLALRLAKSDRPVGAH